MKFIAQNYDDLKGVCLNEAKYQQMASLYQFAESAAFWDAGPGFGTHLTRKSDTMET